MNRLLILAILNGLLAIVVGFVAIPGEQALFLVKYTGYWLILATAILMFWKSGLVIKRSLVGYRFDKAEILTLVTVPAGWLILVIHEPFRFKILMDETMLLGTSMSMHFDKLIQTPFRGHDLQGAYILVEGLVDKRPYFFPFLVSLFHDVIGYRPENAFILNGLLGLIFLSLLYVVGRKLAGRTAAAVGVLLFAGLPLLGQNVTGGGFELLNLTMVTLTLWLGIRFCETGEASELSAFCLSGILLAQTRYESALFIVPVLFTIFFVWWRDQRLVISWTLAMMPLLLLPVPLLQKVFQLRQSSWEMFSQPGADQPFSISFIIINLAHSWGYFFNTTGAQPNSFLLSVLGLLGLAFLMLHLIRTVPKIREVSRAAAVTTIFSLSLLCLFALLMCYFWGKFDDPVITRLSLPIHLLFVLSLWLVVPSFPAAHKFWCGLIVLCGIQLWALSIPSMASHAYTLNYVHGREVAWRREFIEEHPLKDYLVVDPSSIFWITNQISATSPEQAKTRKEALIFHRRNHSFSEIYIYQRFDVDEATGELKLVKDFDVGSDYVLETVVERRLHPFTLSRISRVVDIKAGTIQQASESVPVSGAVLLNDEQKQKIRQEYWNNWMSNLP